MLALQSAQGQPDVAGGRHVPDPDAVPAHGTPPASQWPVVPAELPARQLARLSLLGQRAGAVSRGIRITLRRHSGAPPYIGCCRCTHRIVPISGKPEIGCGEPAIPNHGPRVVDSGLATFRGAPEGRT